MYVLGLESTCDETGCSIVQDGKVVLSNVIASQIELQAEYGGVVPELACRRHIEVIIPVIHESIAKAKVSLHQIDLIAAARGPGLIGALLIGFNAGKSLSWALGKPFIGVNHVEAHLYAAIMSQEQFLQFPCIGIVLSGGHTAIHLVREIGEYELIGQTIDDALGEAFDKTAKVLDLPYPGGPQIEQMARQGDPYRYSFRSGSIKNQPFHFSFSGLKTQVLYTAKGQGANYRDSLKLSEQEKKDLAASFQHAAFTDIIEKALRAVDVFQCDRLMFGGGVCCNQRLREMFQEVNPNLKTYWPSRELTLDNAAMIAGLGYHRFRKQGQQGDPLELEAESRMVLQ